MSRASGGKAVVLTQAGSLPCYRFPHLADCGGLRHALFTRHGGVSRGAFNSLNVTLGLGDPAARVLENRARISSALGGGLVFVHQVHGLAVAVADGTAPAGEDEHPTADAVITADGGRMLVVQVADCQPVLLYDPVRRAAAAVHSGWRGSVGNIIGRSVAALQERFGCRPADFLAGIGPSLGPCCAEFVNYRREIPGHLWSYRGAGDRFDFWAMSRDQLIDAGVRAANIVVSGLCTRCRTDTFFSYRGERLTGRFAAVIGMEGGAARPVEAGDRGRESGVRGLGSEVGGQMSEVGGQESGDGGRMTEVSIQHEVPSSPKGHPARSALRHEVPHPAPAR